MPQFLGDIAFMLELFAVAGGLVLLYQASRENAGLLRAAGLVLVIGGILTAACTGYFYFRYFGQGGFDTVHPPMMRMNEGMMRQMNGKDMQMKAPMCAKGACPMMDEKAQHPQTGNGAEHRQHHPGGTP